jgi:hypothetical protein
VSSGIVRSSSGCRWVRSASGYAPFLRPQAISVGLYARMAKGRCQWLQPPGLCSWPQRGSVARRKLRKAAGDFHGANIIATAHTTLVVENEVISVAFELHCNHDNPH